MSTIDSPGLGSPFLDDLRHDKELRNCFLHAIALTTLAVILAGAFYVYSILEPFIVPLFWALLTGVLLHPYKKTLTFRLRQSLVRMQKEEQNVVVSLSTNTIQSIDRLAEFIGEYFLQKWRIILSGLILVTSSYTVYIYIPDTYLVILSYIRDFLLVHLPDVLGSVQTVHLGLSCVLSVSTLLLVPQYKMCCSVVCLVTWTMLLARVFNYLWPPVVYLIMTALVVGYIAEPSESEDQTDGSESRLKSILFSVLRRVNLIRSAEEVDAGLEDTKLDLRGPDPRGPSSSTPIPGKVVDLEPVDMTPRLDLKLGVIPHPGVSALKKEHGVLINRPNVSDIGKMSTPVGSNTPRSRAGRSFRYAKRKASLAAEIHHDSMRYITWVLWSCCLAQLWLHPGLLHLLPAPIFYALIKRLVRYTGTFSFVQEQISNLQESIRDWISSRETMLLPPPVGLIHRILHNIQLKCLQTTIDHLDSLVTSFLILGMVVVVAAAGIFISIQVYAESAYILQSLASIASSLQMKDSVILSTLNITLPDNSSMEGVVDEAYNYGRTWISTTLRESLVNTDTEVMLELETKVLELWDRSYQYWILRQDGIGPKMTSSAVSTSFGEVMDKLYHTQNIFNISALQVFIRNNMGTLTSIIEQLWSLFQGNIIFLFDSVMGIARVLLHSGSGFINFVFGIIIYLTALFYLLSNSSLNYRPMEVLGQYVPYQGSGMGTILQTAVNSVLFITVKMSSFYLLWTYLNHTVFQATIVVLPMLFSSFIAAVPFTGQYIVAVPASLELWLLQDRPVPAILLIVFQVAPSWLVDAAIYSEMKGGIHPWFTGLAVVGGVYVFGVVGAVYGPLALCVLYVLVNLYTSFMQEIEPPTPVGFKSMRTPLNRSDTLH